MIMKVVTPKTPASHITKRGGNQTADQPLSLFFPKKIIRRPIFLAARRLSISSCSITSTSSNSSYGASILSNDTILSNNKAQGSPTDSLLQTAPPMPDFASFCEASYWENDEGNDNSENVRSEQQLELRRPLSPSLVIPRLSDGELIRGSRGARVTEEVTAGSIVDGSFFFDKSSRIRKRTEEAAQRLGRRKTTTASSPHSVTCYDELFWDGIPQQISCKRGKLHPTK